MPVRVDAVYEVMTRQRMMATDARARWEQAYRTAWADHQGLGRRPVGSLGTEMVDFEEVFMPYILSGREILVPSSVRRPCEGAAGRTSR